MTRYSLAKYTGSRSVIDVNGVLVGKKRVVIAGPCSVESKEQIIFLANKLKELGVDMLRGGAFKPRTYPGTFEGYKRKALLWLKQASKLSGLPVVTEVMSPCDVELVASYADVLQVGARNMQNYPLLDALGRISKPVLLKRGLCAHLKEFLGAAERILAGGNNNVILCLRGVRTFDNSMRFTPDMYAIPWLKKHSSLPVIFDPSHAGGLTEYIKPLSLMALAGGCDGLIVEVHEDPPRALSDKDQQLSVDEFSHLMKSIK